MMTKSQFESSLALLRKEHKLRMNAVRKVCDDELKVLQARYAAAIEPHLRQHRLDVARVWDCRIDGLKPLMEQHRVDVKDLTKLAPPEKLRMPMQDGLIARDKPRVLAYVYNDANRPWKEE